MASWSLSAYAPKKVGRSIGSTMPDSGVISVFCCGVQVWPPSVVLRSWPNSPAIQPVFSFANRMS